MTLEPVILDLCRTENVPISWKEETVGVRWERMRTKWIASQVYFIKMKIEFETTSDDHVWIEIYFYLDFHKMHKILIKKSMAEWMHKLQCSQIFRHQECTFICVIVWISWFERTLTEFCNCHIFIPSTFIVTIVVHFMYIFTSVFACVFSHIHSDL